MRPERAEGAEGAEGDLRVPMAWMHAEYIADEMLRSGDLMPPTTLEFRAGRAALALTIFLSDGSVGGPRVVARMAEWRSLTAAQAPWREWVCERLDRLEAADFEAGHPTRSPDLDLAAAAWHWLEETELLAPDLDAVASRRGDTPPRAEVEGPQVWTPAWQLGLPLGHLSIHLY